MSSSVRSPSKERKDDASPGLQTPNDASPEHSIATPGHEGGRSSGTKRSRDDELEGETSTDRATRSRSASTVERLPGLRVRVKSVCGDLSSVITKLRDSGLSAEERARLDDQADALREELECLEGEVYDVYEQDDEIAVYVLEFIKFARAKARPTANFTTMPNDVLHLVLRHFRKEAKQLIAMSTVNKQMRDAVRNPIVWQSVDLRAYKSSITDKILYSIVQDDDAFSCVKRLYLRDCSQLTDRSVLKVLRKCYTTIEYIDLEGCERLTEETLRFIMHECKQLIALNVRGCSGVSAKYIFDNFFALPDDLVRIKVNDTRGIHGRVDQDDFLKLAESVEEFTAKYKERIGDAAKVQEWEARLNSQSDVLRVAEFIKETSQHVSRWKRGESAACDHAHTIQLVGSRRADPILTLFPECGHVSCVDCTLNERRHMRLIDGEYIYPCGMCHEPMPSPGGFEVVVRGAERRA